MGSRGRNGVIQHGCRLNDSRAGGGDVLAGDAFEAGDHRFGVGRRSGERAASARDLGYGGDLRFD